MNFLHGRKQSNAKSDLHLVGPLIEATSRIFNTDCENSSIIQNTEYFTISSLIIWNVFVILSLLRPDSSRFQRGTMW